MNATTSPIKQQITETIKTAMRAQEKDKVTALRMITAALKQKEVDERIALTDEHVLAILDRLAKQRRESIEQYQAAEREDLVAKERFELEIIQSFLPAALDEAEIDAIVKAAIAQSGAVAVRDMGKVMGLVKPQVQGRADMAAVSARVKALLG